jgi:BioD-like phosphotransacetylase family protein
MISAMSDEGAEEYFRRIGRKAVVAGGDRPDIHMPALATDTSCIVLTEGHDPDPTVLKTAEDQGVPLLKVRPSTVATLEHISDALGSARFRQAHKVGRAVALFGDQIDDGTLKRLFQVGEAEAGR